MWAFSHIILSVVEHLGLVVPLVDDLVGEEASSRKVPTVVVDFLHHLPSLFGSKASQIQVRVETEVGFLI